MIHTNSNPYSKTLVVFLTITDSLLLYASFKSAYWLEFKTFLLPIGYYQALMAVAILSWIISSLFRNAYHPERLKSLSRITTTTLGTMVPYAIILASYILFVDTVVVPVNFMVMVHALFLLASIFAKYIMLTLYSFVRNKKENRSKTIIIGYTNAGRELYRYFRKDRRSGTEFLGFFDDKHHDKLITGKLSDVRAYCLQHHINEIYYALPANDALIKEITAFADDNFIHFGLVQDLSGLNYDRLHTHNYGNEIPVISYTKAHTRHNTSKMYDEFSLKFKNLPFSN